MTDSSCAAAAHRRNHCPWQLDGAKRTLAKVPGHMSIRISCVTLKKFLQSSGPQQTHLGTRDHRIAVSAVPTSRGREKVQEGRHSPLPLACSAVVGPT